MTDAVQHQPKPKFFREKIGDSEYQLEEAKLDVRTEVSLWDKNPRLQPILAELGNEVIHGEEDLAAALRRTKGYDQLKRHIEEQGQLEPIYIWRREGMKKALVLEGATRVTILRELADKYKGTPDEARFARVTAKILPEEFTEEERVILLAAIHVRGSAVRAWGRYIEAKFIHDSVNEVNGKKAVINITQLAKYMGKSVSWVSRLEAAYKFAKQYVDYVDTPDAQKQAVTYFSILEEISKSSGFGAKVRDPQEKDLRETVFDMVRNDVFSEYRDARFMREFYEDPAKWEQLKSHEKGIANKLAKEVSAGNSSIGGKITALPDQIRKTLTTKPDAIEEGHLEHLQEAARLVASSLNNVSLFRLQLRDFTTSLRKVGLDDIKQLTPDEMNGLNEGLEYFNLLVDKFKTWN